MKKIAYFGLLCLSVFLSACTSKEPAKPSEAPAAPEPTPITLVQPYEDSVLNEMDYSVFYEPNIKGKVSGDEAETLTKEELIAKYGDELFIPKALELIDDGEQTDGYHYFTVNNSNDGSSVRFALLSKLYDSQLIDYYFLLADNGKTEIGFFYYYDEKTIEENRKYGVVYAEWCCGGPLYFYDAYYITADPEMAQKKELLDQDGDYSLYVMQSFQTKDDTDGYQQKGIDILKEVPVVKFVK